MDDDSTPNAVRLHHQVAACQPEDKGVDKEEGDRRGHEVKRKAMHRGEDNGGEPDRSVQSEHRLEAFQEDATQPEFFHETVHEGKDQAPHNCRYKRIYTCEALRGEHEGCCCEEEEHEPADAHAQF